MKTNVENFKQYLKRKELSSKTIVTYVSITDRFLSWLQGENTEAEDVRHQEILAFMKHCQKKGTSQRTVQQYLGAVRSYYDHLVEENAVKVNPVYSIKVQGVKRQVLYPTLDTHELHAIYNAYKPESLSAKKNKVITGLLVYQGLKSEELDNLEVTDLKLKEGKLYVAGGRKSSGRTLQLESFQVLDIYEYMMEVRPKILEKTKQQTTKLLVSIEAGPRVRISFLMKQLKKQNSKLKSADHIRASVIAKWLKQYNLREVQYLAGHRYISSTEAYKRNEMEGLSEKVNQFHPLG